MLSLNSFSLPTKAISLCHFGDDLQLFSFDFGRSQFYPISKGERFYPGLMCCDGHVCQNWAWFIIRVVSVLFPFAICWPWYIWIGSFDINYMGCFSKNKMRKRNIGLILSLLAISIAIVAFVQFSDGFETSIRIKRIPFLSAFSWDIFLCTFWGVLPSTLKIGGPVDDVLC